MHYICMHDKNDCKRDAKIWTLFTHHQTIPISYYVLKLPKNQIIYKKYQLAAASLDIVLHEQKKNVKIALYKPQTHLKWPIFEAGVVVVVAAAVSKQR
jgi:hypothetical protein